MKRHEALVPLSKEHHQSLLLARLLQKDAPPYPKLPSTTVEKIKYALEEYHSHILPHLRKEEKMFNLVRKLNEQISQLAIELEDEHIKLESYFTALNSANPDTELMDITGKALENHIRKEERIFFPLLQEAADENLFEQIKLLL